MKNIFFFLALIVTTQSALAEDKDMKNCSGAMDIAESSLRIALNKPAQGSFPKELRSSGAKLNATKTLLRIEMQFPGCLSGAYGDESNWEQYKEVRSLFNEFMGDENF